jgi:hypothetical protein
LLFLVGSYDGSGNYGDVLQLATAVETAGKLPGSPLVVPIVERETLGHHKELMDRYGKEFEGATFAFFQDGPGPELEDGLAELPAYGPGPKSALVYIYGGGFLNGWWGARKAAHVTAGEQLLGGRSLPVVGSGLQVDEATIAPGGSGHELLSRASWIGLRDSDSLKYVRRQIPDVADRVELAGDDAVRFLERGPAEPGSVVNLHVNDGSWISDEPGAIQRNIVALLRKLAVAAAEPLEVQPVIAYEDPRVSERKIVSTLLERHGHELEEAGLKTTEPLDVLDDAIANELAAFRRARLTISCSYHVALTSLLAGIPTVLLAQNGYYEQKAAGLRDLFQLDPGRIGVPGTPENAPAAIEALVDGPNRAELVAHLRTQSRRVRERFERGRSALSVALAEGLELSALESELSTTRQRAEDAESELAAVHATRGWKFLNRLRAIRDMMR